MMGFILTWRDRHYLYTVYLINTEKVENVVQEKVVAIIMVTYFTLYIYNHTIFLVFSLLSL
jgi:hypothetical protein